MQRNGWELLSRSEIDFAPGENTFRLTIIKEVWKLPDGKLRTYFKANRPDCVMIVGFDMSGKLISIKEFQPGVGTYYLKMPGGTLDQGMSPEAMARQEFLEETGYDAGTMDLVTTMAFDSGGSDRKVSIFLARSCKKVQEPETGIEVSLDHPLEFLNRFAGYLLADPQETHGGANTVKAIFAVFAKLNLL